MDNNSQSKIVIYRGWDKPGQYVWSPFVTKVEFRFRVSRLSYSCAIGSTTSGPNGKIPYLQLSTPVGHTETLADSTLIIKDLVTRGLLNDINAGLSAQEKGYDLAVRGLMEDKLYFFHTYERWIKNYCTMRDHVMWSIPYPLRILIGLLAYQGNVRKLHDQGTGRFSDTEIRAFIKEIWEGISGILEESQAKANDGECIWVLGGKEPTEADATVFGFIVSVLVCDAGPESRNLLKTEFPIVMDYATRIHYQYFPDYEIWS